MLSGQLPLKTVILKDSPCIKQATDEHMQYMMIFSFRIVVQGLFLYNVQVLHQWTSTV